ncbi:hypothetical protein D920_02506 [Enterococcus faecalis 13-SD-W-01]|nr:hypothetical protein D920_02506 [Enterococcus faecalis 13-SD-W-01]
MAVGIFLWDKLPENIPTHFDANFSANGWSSKPFAVFGLPLVLLGIHLMVLFLMLNDPKNKDNRFIMKGLLFLMPMLSIFMYSFTFVYVFDIDLGGWEKTIPNLFIGFVFIFCGVILRVVKQNYTVGIRLPWTLSSPKNWELTHRLGAKTFIWGGVLLLVTSAIRWNDLILVIVLFVVGIPSIYSFWLYRKGI